MTTHVIKTTDELEDFLEKNASLDRYNPDEQYTIKFDSPERERAMIVITRGSEELIRINCWRWKETFYLRKAMHYGDNHRCRSVTWHKMWDILTSIMITKVEDRYPARSPVYGSY